MTQICKVCNHPDRKAIERQIVSSISKTVISRKFDVPRDSVYWHERHHLSGAIGAAASRSVRRSSELHGVRLVDTMLNKMVDLTDRAEGLLDKAEDKNQIKNALAAVAQIRNNVQLILQAQAEFHRQQQSAVIEVSEQDEQDRKELREGLKSLTTKELKLYLELNMKMMENIGGSYRDEDPDSDPGMEINPDDHSLRPRQIPKRKRKDSDGPMRKL